MVDLSQFEGITPDEIIILMGLLEPAKEAKRLAQMLSQVYVFKPDEKQKIVLNDGMGYEYITRDGVWHGRYKDRNFDVDVECTAERIFELLRGEYLVRAGYVDRYSNDLMTLAEMDAQQDAYIYSYFKQFIKRTESQR